VPWAYHVAEALHLLAETAPSGTDPITGITGQILSYGVVGAFAVILAIVLYRGIFVRASDAKADADARVEAARADLLREIEHIRAEKQKAEEQRDAALKVAQEQLVPLLTSFVATSQSLIPLLQELVRNRER